VSSFIVRAVFAFFPWLRHFSGRYVGMVWPESLLICWLCTASSIQYCLMCSRFYLLVAYSILQDPSLTRSSSAVVLLWQSHTTSPITPYQLGLSRCHARPFCHPVLPGPSSTLMPSIHHLSPPLAGPSPHQPLPLPLNCFSPYPLFVSHRLSLFHPSLLAQATFKRHPSHCLSSLESLTPASFRPPVLSGLLSHISTAASHPHLLVSFLPLGACHRIPFTNVLVVSSAISVAAHTSSQIPIPTGYTRALTVDASQLRAQCTNLDPTSQVGIYINAGWQTKIITKNFWSS